MPATSLQDKLPASIARALKAFLAKTGDTEEVSCTLNFIVGMVRERQPITKAEALAKKLSEIEFTWAGDQKILPSMPEMFELVSKHPFYYPSKIDERLIRQIGLQHPSLVAGRHIFEIGSGTGRVARILIEGAMRLSGSEICNLPANSPLVRSLPHQITFNDISLEYCHLAQVLTRPHFGSLGDESEHAVNYNNQDFLDPSFTKQDFFVRDKAKRLLLWGGLGNCNLNRQNFYSLLKESTKNFLPDDAALFFLDLNTQRDSLMAAYNNTPTQAMMWSLFDNYRQLLGCKDPEEYKFDLDISYNDLTQKIEVVFTAKCDHTWERMNEYYGPPIKFRKGEKIAGPFSIKGPKFLTTFEREIDDFAEIYARVRDCGLAVEVVHPALGSVPDGPWRETVDPINIIGMLCRKPG